MASLLVLTAATIDRVWRVDGRHHHFRGGSLASKDRPMVRASRDVARRSFYTAVKTAYAFDFNESYAVETKGDK